MNMIILSDVTLTFGQRVLLKNLTAVFRENDRLGLVGRNGFGKSTLLKVIAGMQSIDSGTVNRVGDKRIAYLNQDLMLNSELTARDFVVHQAAQDPYFSHTPEALIYADADRILRGLGFSTMQLNTPLNALSGGWKMRVALAHLLVLKADFYLFDEPTNHLDLFAKDWFLSFLAQASFGFLLVCHEKYFLNKLSTKIFALDTPSGRLYNGNYDAYLAARQAERLQLEAAYTQQQKMIAQKKETIARFRASANKAKMAQSMLKELEKIDVIELPPPVDTMRVVMPPAPSSGTNVLEIRQLSGGYAAAHPIFSGANCTITRNEKVALVAPNGVGKTTFLHTIAGVLRPLSGHITYGYHVKGALFHQEQATTLNPRATIWQEVSTVATTLTESTVRTMLGSFLFSADDIDKQIAVLSGGEKNRVGLVKLFVQQANFLILDEPTNHLDIPSKEILLKALQDFSGTILFVSHDHDFINALATSVIELTPQGLYTYAGNYDDYRAQKKQGAHDAPSAQRTLLKTEAPQQSIHVTEYKQLKKLEQRMEKLAKEREQILRELEKYVYGSSEFTTLTTRLTHIEAEQPKLLNEWISLQD